VTGYLCSQALSKRESSEYCNPIRDGDSLERPATKGVAQHVAPPGLSNEAANMAQSESTGSTGEIQYPKDNVRRA
jgi:hypothetical protein